MRKNIMSIPLKKTAYKYPTPSNLFKRCKTLPHKYPYLVKQMTELEVLVKLFPILSVPTKIVPRKIILFTKIAAT
jgi:hypothetical protein